MQVYAAKTDKSTSFGNVWGYSNIQKTINVDKQIFVIKKAVCNVKFAKLQENGFLQMK